MLAEFLDKTKDSKADFEGTKIMESEYAPYLNTKPVLFITFRSVKGNNKDNFLSKYFKVLRSLYVQHKYLFSEESLLDIDMHEDLMEINTALKKWANVSDEIQRIACQALPTLLEAMREYYGEGVYLFIDEYDTPFVDSYIHGYYTEVQSLIVSNLTDSLKREDNVVSLAMLTGIQRIAKESIFSGLNNLKVYSVQDDAYSQYFGFTTNETEVILSKYELELNEDVKRMYDGYLFGEQEIYNPWSIINYVVDKKLKPYWVNTGSNQMIKEAMNQVEPTFREEFEKLIEKGYIITNVSMETSFYEQPSKASLWGLLVNAGYLTIMKIENKKYTMQIPNHEVLEDFQNLTVYYLQVDEFAFMKMKDSLIEKDSEVFYEYYEKFILTVPSYNDIVNENSVHMLMLGLCVFMMNNYKIISNREVGKGRCDLILKPLRSGLPSYVLEFKYAKKEDYEANPNILKELCREAIEQIRDKHYDAELSGDILHVGLAHCNKEMQMMWVQKNEAISIK